MDSENNIIAIRKVDISLAHKAFAELMNKTEIILNREASVQPEVFKSMSPSAVEDCAVDRIKAACVGSPFNPDEVQLVSGHRFPDIVAENFYGIEVKSTKSDHWKSTGSSIVESTRIENVEDIYMLFGKLGGDTPKFRCRPYQDVLYDIAVTHSPRYLIDMQLGENEDIFTKMGTTYDELRTSPDTVSKVRHYYKEQARLNHRLEMPWWITDDNIDNAHPFNIRLWNSLSATEKRELKTKCMILFPEALNPSVNKLKYNNTTLWLCSFNQVINPNVRDMYSAGGRITHVDGKRLEEPVSRVFNVIIECAEEIKILLEHPSDEMTKLIEDFNPQLLQGSSPYEEWLKICCTYAQTQNVPLMEWIEKKPIFSFSK
ncbi:MAG: hypothetical protein ACI3ZO_01515 [Candidatus Cryptobacteroides sp.]